MGKRINREINDAAFLAALRAPVPSFVEPVMTKEASLGFSRLEEMARLAKLGQLSEEEIEAAALTDPTIAAALDHEQAVNENAALRDSIMQMEQQMAGLQQQTMMQEQALMQAQQQTQMLSQQVQAEQAGRQQAVEQAIQSKDQQLSEIVNQQMHREQVMQAADQLAMQLKQIASTSPAEQQAQQMQAMQQQQAMEQQDALAAAPKETKKQVQEAQNAQQEAQVQEEQAEQQALADQAQQQQQMDAQQGMIAQASEGMGKLAQNQDQQGLRFRDVAIPAGAALGGAALGRGIGGAGSLVLQAPQLREQGAQFAKKFPEILTLPAEELRKNPKFMKSLEEAVQPVAQKMSRAGRIGALVGGLGLGALGLRHVLKSRQPSTAPSVEKTSSDLLEKLGKRIRVGGEFQDRTGEEALGKAASDASGRPKERHGVLTLAGRESLKAKQFAIPTSKAKKLGVSGEIQGEAKGKYPIDNPRRAKNALSRVSQFGTPGERMAVRRKVYAKYPDLREGFKERHEGESPTSKRNLRKVEQGNVGKTAAEIPKELLQEATKPRLKDPALGALVGALLGAGYETGRQGIHRLRRGVDEPTGKEVRIYNKLQKARQRAEEKGTAASKVPVSKLLTQMAEEQARREDLGYAAMQGAKAGVIPGMALGPVVGLLSRHGALVKRFAG